MPEGGCLRNAQTAKDGLRLWSSNVLPCALDSARLDAALGVDALSHAASIKSWISNIVGIRSWNLSEPSTPVPAM